MGPWHMRLAAEATFMHRAQFLSMHQQRWRGGHATEGDWHDGAPGTGRLAPMLMTVPFLQLCSHVQLSVPGS